MPCGRASDQIEIFCAYITGNTYTFSLIQSSSITRRVLRCLLGPKTLRGQQLFFSISVNSGRIFTEPRSGEVNILPLFTEIEKNNCFSIYTLSDLNNIFRRKPLKIDSETLAKREFTIAILFLFGLRIIHSVGGGE